MLPSRITNGKILIHHDPRVVGLIPHTEVKEVNGKKVNILPHRNTEVRLLRNLGYEVGDPILHQYAWNKIQAYEHQKYTAALMSFYSRAYVLNGIGTGKTLATLFAIDYLKQNKEINKILIVAPLSTLTTVWEREVLVHMPHMSTTVLHGTKAQRIKNLQEDVDIYVINHDGVETIQNELLKNTDIDCVVVDELAAYRNHRTNRWKALNLVSKHRKYMWGLTGSPTPNDATDAYGQVRLLTPANVPKYFKQFKNQTMMQVSTFRWIERKEAKEIVHKVMQPAVRYSREECIDLPPLSLITLEPSMSQQQEHVYNKLMRDMIVQWQGGEVTAVNAGVQMSKLLQVSCGFAYTNARGVIRLKAKERLKELISTIQQAEGKVIVYNNFKFAVRELYAIIKTLGFNAAIVTGDTPKKERDKIFNTFQHSKFPEVLVAHPGCMSHGLTLTAANVIIWYGPPMSYETYEQANGRITRPGQNLHQLIVHIESSPIERRAFKKLSRKQSAQNALLELFEENIY